MKNNLIRILLLNCILLCCSNNLYSQLNVGLRDNRYAHIAYEFKNDWEAKLEHSIYSEKIGFQKIRAYMTYSHTWSNFTLKANVYGSTLWNAGYQDFGANLSAGYRILKLWNIEATVNPHYDTEYNYKTYFNVSTDVQIIKNLGIIAQYTTIPEYRLSENRVRAGLLFSYGGLYVTPMLSIPVDGEVKSLRVLCSFEYKFKFKRRNKGI